MDHDVNNCELTFVLSLNMVMRVYQSCVDAQEMRDIGLSHPLSKVVYYSVSANTCVISCL